MDRPNFDVGFRTLRRGNFGIFGKMDFEKVCRVVDGVLAFEAEHSDWPFSRDRLNLLHLARLFEIVFNSTVTGVMCGPDASASQNRDLTLTCLSQDRTFGDRQRLASRHLTC
jgi:hypothetical protein